MNLTKRQLIDLAMEELGIASYVFDSSPGQYQFALMRLELLIAAWNANGVRLSYPLASTVDSSSLNNNTNIPDYAIEAVVLNLAIRLAPSYRINISPATRLNADTSYAKMLNLSAQPTPTKDFPGGLPLGQGNKNYTKYTQEPSPSLSPGYDSEFEIGTS